MPATKQVFDLAKFLESQNTFIKDIDPQTGAVQVESVEGGKGYLNVDGFLQKLGIDRSKVDVQINNPDTAVARNVVSAVDRTLLASGNVRGNLRYLAQKYDDVSYSQEKGVVVRKGALWHQLDPEGLGQGDAWEKTRELMRDIGEIAPGFVGKGAAIAKGAAVGATMGAMAGGVGAIPGAIAGAGVAGFAAEGIESVLGKALGTYEGDASEMVAEAAVEGLLAAGGYTVALGARPLSEKVFGAFAKIRDVASPTAKNAVAQITAKATQSKLPNIERLINRPEPINRVLDKFIRTKGMTDFEAQAAIRDNSIRTFTTLGRGSFGDLSRQFGKAQESFLEIAPKMLKDDPLPLVDDVMGFFQSQNLITRAVPKTPPVLSAKQLLKADPFMGAAGTSVEEGVKGGFVAAGKSSLGELPGVSSALSRVKNVLAKEGVQRTPFQVISKKAFDQAIGDTVPVYSRTALYKGIQELVNKANTLIKTNGKVSTETLLNFRRELDHFIFKSNIMGKEEVQKILGPVSAKFRQGIVRMFESEGPEVINAYKSMNKLWTDHIEKVTRVEKFVATPEAAGAFVRRLAAPETYSESITLLKEIGALRGTKGRILADHLQDLEAAREFTKIMPNLGLLAAGGIGTGVGLLTGSPVLGAAAIGATLVGSSPRIVARGARLFLPPQTAAKALPYMKQYQGFMKGLGSSNAARFMSDPTLAATLATSLSQSFEAEDAITSQLLNQAGATRGK